MSAPSHICSSCAEEKEELLLVFTHLDPNNHQQEFQLGVQVVADNRYTGALITTQCVHNSLVMRRRALCLAFVIRQWEVLRPVASCMWSSLIALVCMCSDEVCPGAGGSGSMSGGAQ